MQLVEVVGETLWVCEDAEPIDARAEEADMKATIWVHSDIIRFTNKFSVDF